MGSNEVLALETTIKPDKPSINDSKNQVGKNKKHDLGNFKRFEDKNAVIEHRDSIRTLQDQG